MALPCPPSPPTGPIRAEAKPWGPRKPGPEGASEQTCFLQMRKQAQPRKTVSPSELVLRSPLTLPCWGIL